MTGSQSSGSRSAPLEGVPKLYTIPSGVSFVDALARGVLSIQGEDPLALSRATILLPTRRACRVLQEAFLRSSGGRPLLLPRLRPLGDLDAEELLLSEEELRDGVSIADLPPAMPPLKRQLLLAQLIRRWGDLQSQRGESHAFADDQAVLLAAELGRLLDQVETEGLSFDRLRGLVPETYAAHWRITLEFLEILTEEWPRLQAAHGALGQAERRRRVTELQTAAWRTAPPADPVLVAGSTGSIPATAELISVVARLPQGAVVLPGLDLAAPDEIWQNVTGDPTHPQHGMAQLLARIGAGRDDVQSWPHATEDPIATQRSSFVAAALLPAADTASWPAVAAAWDEPRLRQALAGVQRIDCASESEEAGVIALILRRALEIEQRTAALVTPDRSLARRVAAELTRWGLEIDDSAGTPLAHTPPGAFLILLAEAAAGFAPLPLLALFKHPLCTGSSSPGKFRRRVRDLEIKVLRGPRPAPGLDGITAALQAAEGVAPLCRWWVGLSALLAPFAAVLKGSPKPLSSLLDAHLRCAEDLAATKEETGAARLWTGENGEVAADFVADLRDCAGGDPTISGAGYPAVLLSLMSGRVVRPRFGRHPRLSILGPLEARLQHADVMILGGLNEGTWPAETDPGPWLSRPMRSAFGLPVPERRVGLAAQDFAQALGAPSVYLTRAARVEGTPTVPSRWLLRLEAVEAAVPSLEGSLTRESAQWISWAAQLDRPAEITPVGRPAPKPPVDARPRELSVTRVETWVRDPYALYAERILRLRALDPLDADPSAAERGTLIHAVLEEFIARCDKELPPNAYDVLLEIGREHFRQAESKPGLLTYWWPRFERIAAWIVETESERRTGIGRSFTEIVGRLAVEAPAGPFILTAKADRIDRLRSGNLVILDYKTGSPPKKSDLSQGFAPQLPLEAAIAAAGGFGEKATGPVQGLEFWQLSGGEPAGRREEIKGDPAGMAQAALEGLRHLVADFDDPDTPYAAMPRPGHRLRFNDYTHLARIQEWSAGRSAEDT